MSSKYILDGHKLVREPDLLRWGRWFEKADKHVAVSAVNGCRISTVFLGLDHQHGEGPPLLFETMVFRGNSPSDLACERYSTWAEAEAGHAAMVKRVAAGEIGKEPQ